MASVLTSEPDFSDYVKYASYVGGVAGMLLFQASAYYKFSPSKKSVVGSVVLLLMVWLACYLGYKRLWESPGDMTPNRFTAAAAFLSVIASLLGMALSIVGAFIADKLADILGVKPRP